MAIFKVTPEQEEIKLKKLIYISAAAGILAFGGIVLAETDGTAEQQGKAAQIAQSEQLSNSGTGSSNGESAPVVPKAQTVSKALSGKDAQKFIGKQQAMEAAQSAAPGKVDDIELEKEGGWIYYEVELEDGKIDYDVIVDAVDGSVVSVQADGDDDYGDDDRDDDEDKDD